MTAVRPKLDIDTTRDRLMALGCMHAAEQLDQMLTEAVRQEVPAHNFLDRLLQAELSGREGRRVKTSLKLSNLPVGQTLENFDFAFQPAIERSRIDTLATCAWVRNGETVLVQGPPGVGKTHLLVGLGIRAVEQGFSVQYFRFDELMTMLKADAALPPVRLKRRKYMSTALLLIDELGFDPMSRQEASLFFRLVSLPVWPGRHHDHHQQERAGLDRATRRRRSSHLRDPRSPAPPLTRAQHSRPQLSSTRS